MSLTAALNSQDSADIFNRPSPVANPFSMLDRLLNITRKRQLSFYIYLPPNKEQTIRNSMIKLL